MRILELEKEKEDKKIIAEKLENEKEMMARKVTNLKKSNSNSKQNNIRIESPGKSKNDSLSYTNANTVSPNKSMDSEESDCKSDTNQRSIGRNSPNRMNLIDDINSDIDNLSRK